MANKSMIGYLAVLCYPDVMGNLIPDQSPVKMIVFIGVEKVVIVMGQRHVLIDGARY